MPLRVDTLQYVEEVAVLVGRVLTIVLASIGGFVAAVIAFLGAYWFYFGRGS